MRLTLFLLEARNSIKVVLSQEDPPRRLDVLVMGTDQNVVPMQSGDSLVILLKSP